MKELEPVLNADRLDSIELQSEQEKKKQLKLVGQMRKINGHTCWQYHALTKKLTQAEYKKQDVVLTTLDVTKSDKLKINHRVDIQKDCMYFQALNRKNAIKKLAKSGLLVVED